MDIDSRAIKRIGRFTEECERMKRLMIHESTVVIRRDNLVNFSDELYYQYYKKEQGKLRSLQEKRLPKLKVTDDIFSLSLYYKDSNKRESRIFFDGTVSLETLTITSVTVEGKKFTPSACKAITNLLKKLTEYGDGDVLIEVDGVLISIVNGVSQVVE